MKRIQDLRERVVLLKGRIIEQPDGSFKETWEEMDEVWAQVSGIGSREIFGEGWNVLTPIQSKYKVLLRHRKKQFTRLKWQNITLGLLCAPITDQRRQWMTCFMYGVEIRDE